MGLLIITKFTLQETIRRRLFLAIIIMSSVALIAFAILLNIAIGLVRTNNGGSLPLPLVIVSLGILITILSIWLVYLLSSILTIVTTAGMISGEIEAGTFAVIIPKPLSRAEVVIGKWLAYVLILGVYTALLYFAFLAVIDWETNYWPPQALNALFTLELSTLALLGLTTMGSAFVPTIVNGAVALMLFIVAPLASVVQFIVQLITPAQSQAMQNMATIINLIIPTDALWHGTSYYLLPSTTLLSTVGLSTRSIDTPFTSAEPIATAFLIWVILYILILPLIAVIRFQHRDL